MDFVIYKRLKNINTKVSNFINISDNQPSVESKLWWNPQSKSIYVWNETEWIKAITTADNLISTNDTATAILYPIMVSDVGSEQRVKSTTANLYFNAVTGQLTANHFNSLSDISLKHNICNLDLNNSITSILKLNPVSFDWNASDKKAYGLIAQELELIFPDLVSETNGYKSIDYISLIPFLIKIIQELIKKQNLLDLNND